MRINRIDKLLSIPISFYVSWRLCGFLKAFHLPVLVRYNSKILKLNGRIVGGGKLDMGFGDIGIIDSSSQRSVLGCSGVLDIKGFSHFGPGARIEIGSNAILSLGNNVANSGGCTIECQKSITIGSDTIISWESLIMDTDFHRVQNLIDKSTSDPQKSIVIGDNCWIGVRTLILKGTIIKKNTIIGAGSLVNKKFDKENILIAGNPANIIKQDVLPVH